MNAIQRNAGGRGCRRLGHGLAALVLLCSTSAVPAQGVVGVPSAHLHHAEGSVAWAPHGDKEWHDVQPRRLLKRGDRLWIDRGSRAEVQAGGHALRLDGETQLVLENVGETATQLSLTQGSIVATVTRMNAGDSFEVGTPNLAFRARQPGDYRIDVDTRQGVTRVVVLSGAGVVFGENGEVSEIRNGQRLSFRERSLAKVPQAAFAATDDFDRWAGARRRGEPTVSMPALATAAQPAPSAPTPSGRTIVISGSPSSLARPAAALPQATAGVKPIPTTVPAAPLRVTAPAATPPVTQANLPAPAPASLAQAAAQVQAAREQQERQRLAQQRAEDERRARAEEDKRAAAAARAEEERRAAAARADSEKRAAAAEARRAEERRRALAAKKAEEDKRAQAKRAEEERRAAQAARREQEQKRLAAARRAEEERRALQAKKAAEEKRLAAARKAEAQKLAEARKRELARLQDQARREEQWVQSRREQQARRAEEERREEQARREDQWRREEQARRDEQWRREEQIRREEEARRQRILIEHARREQERREQEVWLRQQQYQYQQPVRPAPMGVPARRVS